MRLWLCSVPLKGSSSCLPPPLQACWRSDLHFMKQESTEIQLFHTVRKSWKGEVMFLSSKHCTAPLGLQRGGAWQRFLLPAGPAGLARGGPEPPWSLHSTHLGSSWWPGSVGADRWYNCTRVAVANQDADFLPARTHTATAAGAVPGDARAGCGASGTAVRCDSSSWGGTQTGWFGFMSDR